MIGASGSSGVEAGPSGNPKGPIRSTSLTSGPKREQKKPHVLGPKKAEPLDRREVAHCLFVPKRCSVRASYQTRWNGRTRAVHLARPQRHVGWWTDQGADSA
jgi:hypothetical protein